jgi:hypothetical protein
LIFYAIAKGMPFIETLKPKRISFSARRIIFSLRKEFSKWERFGSLA